MSFWYHIIIKRNSFSVLSTSCLKLKYYLFGKNLLFYLEDILNKSMSLFIYITYREILMKGYTPNYLNRKAVLKDKISSNCTLSTLSCVVYWLYLQYAWLINHYKKVSHWRTSRSVYLLCKTRKRFAKRDRSYLSQYHTA